MPQQSLTLAHIARRVIRASEMKCREHPQIGIWQL
jgi:hypothetical protein